MPASQNGHDDDYFISQVRRHMRDFPVWFSDPFSTDGQKGVITAAGSEPFRLQRSPVVPEGAVLTAPGGPYGIVYDVAPDHGQVEINTDTGEVVFADAPPTGSLLMTYQAYRFSDTQICEALYEGLHLLWPDLWRPRRIDQVLVISPVVFEYSLPAYFQDPNTQLLKVEYMPPSGIIRFFESTDWDIAIDYQDAHLKFFTLPPIASQVRITITWPFDNLGQVPAVAMHLPVYYALARLLADQDVMRSRSDDLASLKGEAANKPGVALTTSAYWMDQFDKQLTKLALSEPVRMQIRGRVAERLGLKHRLWRTGE